MHPDYTRLAGKSLFLTVGVGTCGTGNIWEQVKNAKSQAPDLRVRICILTDDKVIYMHIPVWEGLVWVSVSPRVAYSPCTLEVPGELIKNANSWAPPRPTESEMSRHGAQESAFQTNSQVVFIFAELWDLPLVLPILSRSIKDQLTFDALSPEQKDLDGYHVCHLGV